MELSKAICLLPVLITACIFAAACGDAAAPREAAAEQTREADWPREIRVGLVPTEGGADTRARFAPLEDHLTQELDANVSLVSASNYQGVITAMANDQLEFAWLGPKSYVEAARRAGAEALLLELNSEGDPGYRSVFIVPTESDITSLKEARGARFAFTDPNSTSGFLVPSVVLRDELGETAESFFGEVRFSGAHGTSILQVAAGELDIAATNDLDLPKMIEKGALDPSEIRVVYESDLIPGSPFAARRELPESLKSAFSEAIMKLNDKPRVLEQLQNGGYVPTTDDQYDVIRSLQRYVEAEE